MPATGGIFLGDDEIDDDKKMSYPLLGSSTLGGGCAVLLLLVCSKSMFTLIALLVNLGTYVLPT